MTMKQEHLTGLLSLIITVVGGLLGVVWSAQTALQAELKDANDKFNNLRVEIAKEYITGPQLEKRLDAAISPLQDSMKLISSQQQQMLALMAKGQSDK